MTAKERAALLEKTKQLEAAAAELEATTLIDEKPEIQQPQEIETRHEESKETMATSESPREEPTTQSSEKEVEDKSGAAKNSTNKKRRNKKKRK